MTDFSTRARESDRLSLDRLLLVLGACVLVIAAADALRGWLALGRQRETVSQSRTVVAGLKTRLRTLQNEKLTDEQARLASQLVLNADAPPVEVLAALSACLPADVRLEGLTFTYGTDLDLDMQVVARRASAYDDFLGRLAASPHFRDIVPGAESRGETLRAGVHVRFRTGRP
jgi:hypothetical protein